MFNIYLTNEVVPDTDPGVTAAYGKIQIGDYIETFTARLTLWRSDQYEQHWRAAIERLLKGADRSALITSYVEPTRVPDNFLMWWPLYREGETVHVQNQLLFFELLKESFSLENPWASVQSRRTVNDEGMKISEWSVAIGDFAEFLMRQK